MKPVTLRQVQSLIARLSTWQVIALFVVLVFLGPVVAVFVLLAKWPGLVMSDADRATLFGARL